MPPPAAAIPLSGLPSPSVTKAPPTTPVNTFVIKFGAKQVVAGGDLTVTVLSYEQPVLQDAPGVRREGYEYGSLTVEVCNDDIYTQTINSKPFRLVYADKRAIRPSSIRYRDKSGHQFPVDDYSLGKGQCMPGPILFEVPRKPRPTRISYVPDGEGATYFWDPE
jgi:hypothetical protein